MKRSLFSLLIVVALLVGLLVPAAAPAGPLLGAGIRLTQAASGFSQPVYVTGSGDGSGRLWVLERTGRIKIISGGVSRLYYNASARVRSTGSEQGLLGIAFPRNFRTTGRFYIAYTDATGALVVQRLRADKPSSPTPKITVMGTVTSVPHPRYTNHNGGCIQFGPDGFLYIGTGDGGSAGNPSGSAQQRSSRQGKMLRIDVGESRYTAHLGLPRTYRVPDSNPYKRAAGWSPEIWARGLRNPWRWSFDRATGDLWIGDVGQGAFEEVDFAAAPNAGRAMNFGWRLYEGTHAYNPDNPPASKTGLTFPIIEYGHPDSGDPTGGESVIGGYVYRGSAYPSLQGVYFYGDWYNGRIWGLKRTVGGYDQSLLLESGVVISSFGQADSGQLYVVDLATGRLYRIEPAL